MSTHPPFPAVAKRPRPHATGRDQLVLLSTAPDPLWAPVVVRLATADDQAALERLAQLDSTVAPVGQTVIGEVQGRAVAAVSLRDGQTIEDPFFPGREITQLVRLRADQIALKSRRQAPGRVWYGA
jgi:hypothetical protein